jgi:hypothetical protein
MIQMTSDALFSKSNLFICVVLKSSATMVGTTMYHQTHDCIGGELSAPDIERTLPRMLSHANRTNNLDENMYYHLGLTELGHLGRISPAPQSHGTFSNLRVLLRRALLLRCYPALDPAPYT